MAALAKVATRARHANVLSHMVGLFHGKLDAASRRELAFHVTQYRRGRAALAVPLTVVSRYARVFEIKHLNSQTYLNLSPAELALKSTTHSS